MIISHLMGGLGNQMFEYAAGLALARQRRTTLKLDVSFYHEHDIDDRHYALDCLNVPAQFATAEEIQRFARGTTWKERALVRLLNACGIRRFDLSLVQTGTVHYQKQWTYYPEFHQLPDNVWLHGNYQSEKFFDSVADILRSQFSFRYPATAEVEDMAAKIRSKPSVAIHLRRGDYCGKYQSIGAMSFDYYNRALNALRSKVPAETVYYIFSDEIDVVEREFQLPAPHYFVKCVQDANHYDALRLMSSCDHNIIANSTFSWWAAWLNPHPHKLVVAPERWFASGRWDERDMTPQSWLRI